MVQTQRPTTEASTLQGLMQLIAQGRDGELVEQEPPDPPGDERYHYVPAPRVPPALAEQARQRLKQEKAAAIWTLFQEGSPVCQGYNPAELVWVLRRLQERYERQQLESVGDHLTRFDLALQDQTPEFKQTVYQVATQCGVGPDDPLFSILYSTGRLEALLRHRPAELEQAFRAVLKEECDQAVAVINASADSAVQRQRAKITSILNRLLLVSSLNSFRAALSAANLTIAAISVLVVGGAFFGLGRTVGYSQRPPLVTGNVRLDQDQAEALRWVMSEEGQQAQELWSWNRNLVLNGRCQRQLSEQGVALAIEGEVAESGACALWVVPPEQRTFRGD
ncbi:hypothetical protein GFS31_40510 (plasmid) [Leptolyngbya sp. BL0902]|uniref:DUF6753 family protein n=1 Tax=Leptolyngbya sp. BL0902 TaxID=1115757 RepID=UPI0018E7A3FB|nr:DUF6753 family protein [Leptolyngbya sp. BL0902]QQE67338.1 hypothetical protein GFS31_40510 [Leptolyngbya sp. BL0902]